MPMEKTFNAAEAEPRIYETWEGDGAFRAGANAREGAETFCILIPPPNVTGSLHMGHAFNNTLQDILTRWHRMQGHDTLWQPGQDHAGIATQMVVERELAANGEPSRREMGREAFIERVWQQKEKSGGTIIEQLKRLGASCDWSRNAFTMDKNFHDAVLKVFVDMYDKGLIYRGKRLVNWDPHFETAISDLEVEQVEVDGKMWRLRYPLADGETFEYVERDENDNEILRETRDYLTVATTRPETMLGDTGVAVHPEDPRYAHLLGKEVVLPLTGRRIPIVADEYADPTKGTGAVKITPAHDFNDWEVGKRAGLRIINVMNTRAAMHLSDNADFLVDTDPELIGSTIEMLNGQDRYEARDAIIGLARDEGWLDGIDSDRHMVPHGDRSKTAIEPFLTDQWFVDAEKIVTPAIDAVRNGDTRILPERDAKTYFHWLENIEPWCISRQLWWGHQIPVWYGPAQQEDGTFRVDHVSDSGMARFCAINETEALKQAEEFYGRPVTLARNKTEAYLGGIANPELGKSRLAIYRDPDVLDTWFSSGLWPIGTLGWPEQTPELERYFPTNVLITGFDIIFFWVARMMMMQYAVVGQKPFDTVYVHALVRDEKGKKMSKSLGNVLDPLDLIDEFGADAVRFTLAAMAAMGRDLKLSKDRIAGYRNFGTKLWNAVRFAEMNGVFEQRTESQAATPRPENPQQTANRWIIGETTKVREAVDESLQNFRFNDAANALYAFVWGKVCDWYVEFAKPLFASEDAAVVAETRETMAFVLDHCMVLLHPFMPYITEELWSLTAPAGRERMLVLTDWPTDTVAGTVDADADREMNWVISLIEEIRSVRAQMHVPVGLRIPLLQLELDDAGRAAWAQNNSLIQRLARIDSLTEVAELPKGCITVTVEGGTFALPLADVIDIEEEKARLEKTLTKLDKELGGLRGRLGNERFVASAPEEVVAETRERLEQGEDEAVRLKDALARLAALA